MLCLFQRSLARKLPANAGVALWKVALIQADRLLPERRLLGTNPADVLESCFGGLPDAQPLRVCALMRLPQLCRPSVNWRFLVLYGYGPDVRRQGSVAEISCSSIVFYAGIAIGSQIFVDKIQQDLNFRRQPRWAGEQRTEGNRLGDPVPFTIIRPNYFIQNDATLKDALMAGIYPMPLGNLGISVVDIRDIAEATAIVITSNEHNGKTYNLNGPEAISGSKAASIWSQLLGKDIRYAGHDMDAFEEQMRKRAPSWSAFDIRMMFQGYLERGFVADAGDVEKLTKLLGHAPRSYEDFAAETAALWIS